MSTRVVYFNGEFVPERDARISIFDCALLFGDMVFEMTRTFRHKPFRLRQHLDRLYGSLRYARIDCGLDIDAMEAATFETVERNLPVLGDLDFLIMHNVTRGALHYYDGLVREGVAPVVTINIFPLVRHLGAVAPRYAEGAHCVVTPQQSVPSRFIDPKAKNRSRIFYKLADLQAEQMEPGAMPLLTDEHGFLTEGSGNNFFMVRDGEIVTPKGHNILRGVSRSACMDLAEKLGLPLREADIEPYDVRGADEAWCTSTIVSMIPVCRFNFQDVGNGRPGPVYRRLLGAWCEEVGVDIPSQARQYASCMDSWAP